MQMHKMKTYPILLIDELILGYLSHRGEVISPK